MTQINVYYRRKVISEFGLQYLIDWIESRNLRFGFVEDNSNPIFPIKYKWKCYNPELGWRYSSKSFSNKVTALQDLLEKIEFISVISL